MKCLTSGAIFSLKKTPGLYMLGVVLFAVNTGRNKILQSLVVG